MDLYFNWALDSTWELLGLLMTKLFPDQFHQKLGAWAPSISSSNTPQVARACSQVWIQRWKLWFSSLFKDLWGDTSHQLSRKILHLWNNLWNTGYIAKVFETRHLLDWGLFFQIWNIYQYIMKYVGDETQVWRWHSLLFHKQLSTIVWGWF